MDQMVNQSLQTLAGRIGQQNQQLEISLTDVTGILERVASVVELTSKGDLEVRSLLNDSEVRRQVFQEAFEEMRAIASSIDDIQEMVMITQET